MSASPLDFSARRLPKATYVPLNPGSPLPSTGGAVQKFAFVSQLKLQPGEVSKVRTLLSAQKGRASDVSGKRKLWNTLQSFEGAPLPSLLPSPSVFAPIPVQDLLSFGKALIQIRQQSVTALKTQVAKQVVPQNPLQPAPTLKQSSLGKAKSGSLTPSLTALSKAARVQNQSTPPTVDAIVTHLGPASSLVNSASAAVKGFEANAPSSPIGCLNLERLDMVPAGIERGELLATVPLAPGEKTGVVQKEWSVTSQEFTSIVTDSLDQYSEKGVTENNELAQSATSQLQHSNQFNISASVSGGYGCVTASASSNFTSQDQFSQSSSDSKKHAMAVTRKASARVKQEHKTTISTTTITGSENTTTRILENPSTTAAMRIDYFSLMRKWRVRLYRYGLRLTYDIAIPEPGAAMRKAYAQLADLQEQAANVFDFESQMGLSLEDITVQNYLLQTSKLWQVADELGVQIPAPLQDPVATTIPAGASQDPTKPWSAQSGQIPPNPVWLIDVPFDVPEGYEVLSVHMNGELIFIGQGQLPPVLLPFAQWGAGGAAPKVNPMLVILGATYPITAVLTPPVSTPTNQPPQFSLDYDLVDVNNPQVPFLKGATGHQIISEYFPQNVGMSSQQVGGEIYFVITFTLTQSAKTQWVSSVYTALYNAAQAAYYSQQQSINAQIQALQDQINNVDTLTLRREEHDEIMKGVLRWLLGPSFYFMPPEVLELFQSQGNQDNLVHGVNFTGNDLTTQVSSGLIGEAAGFGPTMTVSMSPSDWSTIFQFQEMVKFINEAIDWDNLVYFLYSYFWDEPIAWDFIRSIKHPDSNRQAFLRAGSARVVLTVRPGYETAWTTFVEQGDLEDQLPPDHPYLTIAQEIQSYANTYYPGIPSANPPGAPVDIPNVVAMCTDKVPASPNGQVTLTVDSTEGFIKYNQVSVDACPIPPATNIQETQKIVDIPDSTHITLEKLLNPHDGTSTPFPIVQLGEAGVLIAEWYEYTPTSGTDIAVTSDLATIA